MQATQLLETQDKGTVLVALRVMQELIERQGGTENLASFFPSEAAKGWVCPSDAELEALIKDIQTENHFNSMDTKPVIEKPFSSINVLVVLDFNHPEIPDSVLEALWDGKNYIRNNEVIDEQFHSITGWQYMPPAPLKG
ncbi:hypothetical protein AB6D66_01365 [Vibrio pomeroyi]|uniref:DUF551 domain-containing protein n=1 Tax=Vibrio pomeroyi TaxID=198832 RepID=A0ABV4MRE7_9VIBR|nr:hypothetical protein [Vibrio atlanticus]MCZ4310227.1 hypothetical protein [Vibrio atlanticus]